MVMNEIIRTKFVKKGKLLILVIWGGERDREFVKKGNS